MNKKLEFNESMMYTSNVNFWLSFESVLYNKMYCVPASGTKNVSSFIDAYQKEHGAIHPDEKAALYKFEMRQLIKWCRLFPEPRLQALRVRPINI